MEKELILSKLPYTHPFLFVDELLEINENSVSGKYTFSAQLDFYRGHFRGNPVTPGVILTECMAQIGLVCLGIYLMNKDKGHSQSTEIALSSSNIEYLKPVYPGETVKVISEKEYFRFNKLKCDIKMFDSEENIVCRGNMAGMIIKS